MALDFFGKLFGSGGENSASGTLAKTSAVSAPLPSTITAGDVGVQLLAAGQNLKDNLRDA